MSEKSVKQFLQEDAACIAAFSHLSEVPLVVASAHDSFLVDADGREYLDFISGACTMSMGYGRGSSQPFGSFPFPYASGVPQIKLAQALIKHFPGGVPRVKVSFGVCGSEANDGAIKLCRAYTGRKIIVTFKGDYHGTTFGAVSLTTMPGRISNKFDPLLPGIIVLPFCSTEGTEEELKQCLQALRELDFTQIAGFIVEPVQGDMGMLPMHPALMQAIYELTRRYGCALVADEVQMALHRTGPFFSIEHYPGVIPDAVLLGKSIGGGIPLSCIMGRADFMDSLGTLEHAFSMAGTAEACARGLELLQEIEKSQFQMNLKLRSGRLRQGLRELQQRHPAVVQKITGIGSAFGLWVKSNQPDFDDHTACLKVIRACFDRGLFTQRLGSSWIRIEPQLNISLQDLELGLSLLDEGLTLLESGQLN